MSKYTPGDKVVFKTARPANGPPYHPEVVVPKEGEELTIAQNLGKQDNKFQDDYYEVEEYFDQSFAERCLVPLQPKAQTISKEQPEAVKIKIVSKELVENLDLIAN